jgi:hypothetical protein
MKDAKKVNMYDALRCGWIKTTWDELSDIICGGSGLMRSLGVMGMAMFALGFLAIPYAVTLIFMNKRYGGHGPVARDDGEIPTAKAEEVAAVEKQNPLDFA